MVRTRSAHPLRVIFTPKRHCIANTSTLSMARQSSSQAQRQNPLQETRPVLSILARDHSSTRILDQATTKLLKSRAHHMKENTAASEALQNNSPGIPAGTTAGASAIGTDHLSLVVRLVLWEASARVLSSPGSRLTIAHQGPKRQRRKMQEPRNQREDHKRWPTQQVTLRAIESPVRQVKTSSEVQPAADMET